MKKTKVAKTVKAVRTWATIKNGKINWIAQIGLGGKNNSLPINLKSFAKAFGEKVIRVEIK